MRLDTLTGTEDIVCDGSMALNRYIAIATALQYGRHFLCVKGISAHRGNLAAAIDAMSYTGITLNGDCRITTHQGRVAVSLHTCTTTEDTARNRGRYCAS